MKKLAILNGNIVSDGEIKTTDILVEDGLITALGKLNSYELRDTKIIDATGMWVMPGMIDSHVHIAHPNRLGNAADDFYTATVAAAHGGVTTFIDFAIQWDKSISLEETWRRKVQTIKENTVIDFALHNCPTVSSQETIGQMPVLRDLGSPSFKFYMTYSKQNRMTDDGVLYEALCRTANTDMRVGVHAENDALINFLEQKLRSEGKLNAKYFAESKPSFVENEALRRVVYLNEVAGGNLFLFHVTTGEGARVIAEASAKGQNIIGETCTHYLLLNESYLQGEEGYKYICSPPLRNEKDSEYLWESIREGNLKIISSDHCGFNKELKKTSKDDFTGVPNGLPGIDQRLYMIYSHGVRAGKITIEQMVDVLSTNPAKIFGMYPKKGSLSVGSDADLVIYDPNPLWTLENRLLFNSVDWSPYEGMEVRGKVYLTLSRGEILVDQGKFYGHRGRGELIKR